MQSIVNLDAVFVILNRVQVKRRVENMSEKILIIDDEQDIADLLEVYLKNENYIVYKFYCATDAMSCIESGDIDLASGYYAPGYERFFTLPAYPKEIHLSNYHANG